MLYTANNTTKLSVKFTGKSWKQSYTQRRHRFNYLQIIMFRRISGIFRQCQPSAREACDSLRCSRHERSPSAAFRSCAEKLPQCASDRPAFRRTRWSLPVITGPLYFDSKNLYLGYICLIKMYWMSCERVRYDRTNGLNLLHDILPYIG